MRAQQDGRAWTIPPRTFWFGQRRAWRTLAIVPSGGDACALEMALLVARGAWDHRRARSCVVDLRELGPAMVERQLARVEERARRGEIVLVALRSIFENTWTEPVAAALDAALLCIGSPRLGVLQANQTLERIGRERFIGSVVVRR